MADDNTKLIIVLEAQSRKLQNSLVQVNRTIDKFAAATERRFDAMQKKSNASFAKLSNELRSSVGGLNGILAPLTAALSVREVINYADAWRDAGNKLAAASQVSGIQARSLDELKTSANGVRTSLEEYVDLYSRLLRVSTSVAASELQVARVTDIVAESLKAGGASAQEQQAALIQLGQALGSGILAGDELRSIRENAPLIAKAIAKEFGVTIGELKQLGAEGKLTSDRVFKAILDGGADIDKAFKATHSTIHDAFTRISNEFTAYVGTAGQASGATQALIDALNYLADNFKTAGDVVVTFALILAGALAGKAIAAVVIGLGEAVVALATFLTAMASGTLTVATFTAALGPIAIIASAAAVAIGYLVYQQGEGARVAKAHADALDTNAAAIDVAKDASKEYRDSLRRQIELQIKSAETAIENAKAQLEQADAMGRAAGGLAILVGGLFGEGEASRGAAANTALDNTTAGAKARLEESKKFLDQLQLQLKALDKLGAGTSSKSPSAGANDAKEFKKATDAVIDHTEALIAQTNAQKMLNPLVNDYGYAIEFAKQQTDLLQAAHEAGIKITPELRGQIDFLAAGYANAGAEAKKLAEQQDETRNKAEEFFSGLKDVTQGWIQDLIDGKSAAEALGDALSNVGNRLINLGLDTLFGTGQGSSPFGALGQLFLHKNGGIAANGRPRAFASGGVSNTAAVFGEAGPEAAVPLPDGRRIPVDLRLPSGGASGNVNVSVNIPIDAAGADPAAVARLERVVTQMKTDLPHTIVGAVRDAKKRRAL